MGRKASLVLVGLALVAAAGPPVRGTIPEAGDDLDAYFKAIDGDGDGAISRAEFDRWFASQGQAGDQLLSYWQLLDADGNGKVTRAEYGKFHAVLDRSAAGD